MTFTSQQNRAARILASHEDESEIPHDNRRGLQAYRLLNKHDDPELDVLTALAAEVFAAPIATISLIDEDRLRFKSSFGLDIRETSRDASFCAHVLRGRNLMIVPNAMEDDRFRGNPWVVGPMSIRFFAGVPLMTPEGDPLGSFCLIDNKPRDDFDAGQRQLLERFAARAMAVIDAKYRTPAGEGGATPRPNRRLFESFIEEVPLAVAMVDRDLRYLAVSKKWYDLYEIAGVDVIGRSHFDLVTHVSPCRQEALKELLEHDGIESGREIAIKGKDGEETWIRCDSHAWKDDAGQIGGLIMYRSVINKEVDARKEVERGREIYRMIFDGAPAMMYSIGTEGSLIRVSDLWLERMGYERDEVIGTDILDYVTESSRDFMVKNVRPYIQEKARRNDIPLDFVTKRGEVIKVLLSSNFITDENGNVRLHNAILADVTEKLQVEEALRHSQKMDALGGLTGGIAHDFNNILAIVMGNLQLLERHIPKGEAAAERLQSALDATMRGSDLTRQLLAFSRRQDLNPSRADVNQTLTELYGMVSRTIAESIDISLNLGRIESTAFIDAGLLQNAILNLVLNARDAMKGTGHVRIASQEKIIDGPALAEVGEIDPGTYIVVSIADDGPGMTDDVKKRAFEPFFTTKEVGKGTGLGLAMVYGFIKQSGGNVSLQSEPGRGTTVNLYLPVDNAVAAEQETSVALDAQSDRTARILIVEDDVHVRTIVCLMVKDLGHRYIEASSGSEALSILAHDPAFDLVISDVVMPGGMNGVELAKTIRQRGIEVPVLLTSGYPRDAVKSDEPVHILQKPYKQDALAAEIARLLPTEGDVR